VTPKSHSRSDDRQLCGNRVQAPDSASNKKTGGIQMRPRNATDQPPWACIAKLDGLQGRGCSQIDSRWALFERERPRGARGAAKPDPAKRSCGAPPPGQFHDVHDVLSHRPAMPVGSAPGQPMASRTRPGIRGVSQLRGSTRTAPEYEAGLRRATILHRT